MLKKGLNKFYKFSKNVLRIINGVWKMFQWCLKVFQKYIITTNLDEKCINSLEHILCIKEQFVLLD